MLRFSVESLRIALGALLCSSVLVGCASTSPRSQATFEVEHDVQVSKTDGSKVDVSKGSAVQISNEPLLIEAPGRVSLLAVPVQDTSVGILSPLMSRTSQPKMRLSLKETAPSDDVSSSRCESAQDNRVKAILPQIDEIQDLMSSNQADRALEKIEALQKMFPRVSYINFMKASALILLGDQLRAKAALQEALRDNPGHKAGMMLLESLTNDGRRPSSASERREDQAR